MIKNNDRVDLHNHTSASDGSWSPQELIDELIKADIKVFSITDHDTIANINVTKELAKKTNLGFLSGVEISSTHKGQLYHILGYGIDADDKELNGFLNYNMKLMEDKDDESIRLLIDEGYDIDYQHYLDYQNDTGRGGWKSLNYLIDLAICSDTQDFFNRLFKGKDRMPFPVFPHPGEVISAIKQAGGYAILAHPGCNFYRLPLEETLNLFYNFGIDGFECYHPEHNDEVTKIILQYSKEKDLIITGGSDCHGAFLPERGLGFPNITIEQLNLKELSNKIIF